jgi:hypothetical protein
MEWSDKLTIYSDIYGQRAWSHGPAAINQFEAPLAYLRGFQLEVDNGGFWQFFYNSTGMFALETADALRLIGARESASFLARAIQIYFRGQPIPFDTAERRRLMKEIDGDRTPEADRVTLDYYELEESLYDLMLKYLQENEQHLRVYEDEAATALLLEGDWRQCTQCCDAWEQPVADKLSWCPTYEALTFLREAGSSRQ